MAQQIDPAGGSKPFIPPMHDEKAQRKPAEAANSKATDRVSLSGSDKIEETYKPGIKVAEPYELLRLLVVKTLMDQGVSTQIDVGGNLLDLSTLTPEDAQALIAEDGYFGVEQTSDRIVNFAIGAFGNDPSKLEQMKAAIDKGFGEAQAVFGGALPDISQQTYSAIMEKLDAFAGRAQAE